MKIEAVACILFVLIYLTIHECCTRYVHGYDKFVLDRWTGKMFDGLRR